MSISDNAGLLQPLSDAWTLVRPAAQTKRRVSRAGGALADGAPEIPLPVFLPPTDFEVLDSGEVRATPGRRNADSSSSSSLQLKTELEDDAIAFVVARQESGAISVHLPQRTPNRRSGKGLSRTTFIFDVDVSARNAGTARRAWVSKVVRVILVKVAKAVAGKLVEHAAAWAVPLLARQLEERLWAKRTQGWLRVTPSGLEASEDRLAAGKPAFRSPERGLLLIHGTFSTAHGAFRNFATTRFFTGARKLYGENIYAFNHFTISKTPEENAKDLLDSLPDRDFEFDVITHSRGGLVVRELLERSGLNHPKSNRLRIRNVIMVASPSAGTPLGSPSHWEKKLSLVANMLELLPVPANPFTTGAAWLAESLKWLAGNVLGNCPGLVAMDPGSGYLGELQGPPGAPLGTFYHALVSNFQPPHDWWARLADIGVDNFYDGANDLVVPTEGGWKTADTPTAWIPGERVACFGLGGNLRPNIGSSVHHGAFFGDTDAVSFMLSCLRGEPSKLPAMFTNRTLPSSSVRFTRRIASPQADDASQPTAQKTTPADQPKPEALSTIAGTSGFDEEQQLWLTVVSNVLHTKVEDENTGTAVPLLIAQYGSARVTEPFYTHGRSSKAGKRWESLIDTHRDIITYANGGTFTATEDGFPTDKFLEEFGAELFATLFPGEVRNLYNVARFLHKKRRLKIIFSSMIPWVADMPWELAYDRLAGCFLACGDVRFLRNVLTPTPSNKIPEKDGPLRILVVSAQPTSAARLSIDDERRGIEESFRPLTDAGLAQVEILPAASPTGLQERLRYQLEGDSFDVLHFIGHGEFDEATNIGYLLFQDDAGRPIQLSASSFLNIVRGRDIRVVFLNACETGYGKQADYNRGVAMALARDGIPAVVANQYSVIDRSASLFSLHFYACLAKGLKIGDAMREARIALEHLGVERMDWAVPVLFANNPDAALCTAIARPTGAPMASEDPFAVLSLPRAVLRGAGGSRRKTIAVWDAENALVYRERLQEVLDEFNGVQGCFAFQLERFTAPRGLWAVDRDASTDGVAYLRAENVTERMERIRKAIGADYLFCVTELPLRSEDTTAIYYYQGEQGEAICILSTWDLDPPLEGGRLRKAIANHLAIFLLDELTGGLPGCERDDDPQHPIHTTGFWNDNRNVSHIAGQMKISRSDLSEVRKAIKANKLTQMQFDCINALLNL
jgi:hypothetical protein